MGRPLLDLTGNRYGMLVALKCVQHGTDMNGKRLVTKWRCLCDCGTVTDIDYSALVSRQKSCGCLVEPHGLSHHPLYVAWRNIRSRCTNPAHISYPNYGGRGITMHDEWLGEPGPFIEYIESTLGRKPNQAMSIDRVDNDGNYEPGNLQWATGVQQQNNKRNNVVLTHMGETMTVKQWCRKLELNYITIHARLHRYGWTVEESLSISTDGKQRKREPTPV